MAVLAVGALLAGCAGLRTGGSGGVADGRTKPEPATSPTGAPGGPVAPEVVAPEVVAPEPPADCAAPADTPDDGRTWLLRLVTPGPQYSVADDGTVVEVTSTDIFASVEDYRIWTISDAAVRTVLAALREPRPGGENVPLTEGTFVDVLDPCAAPVGAGWGLEAARVLAAITDPDQRVTEPDLWQPDDLWLIVHPTDRIGTPNAASDPFRPWPLPGTIEDHVVGHDVYSTNGTEKVPVRWVCLSGDDVAPLWQLQQPGTRNTWIRLEDAQGRWEVTIRPAWPGYRLSGDPCGEAT